MSMLLSAKTILSNKVIFPTMNYRYLFYYSRTDAYEKYKRIYFPADAVRRFAFPFIVISFRAAGISTVSP